MKIDLVMWTYNSETTLGKSLRSIEKAVPPEVTGQKIIVDGHSADNTKAIAQKFGWHVYDAEQVGIPYQANQALKLVKTPIFASFEHDIILTENWLSKLLPDMQKPNVAVSQGVRLATDKTLNAIDRQRTKNLKDYVSIDNNLYNTETIKRLGGFNTKYRFCADMDLKRRVQKSGYRWNVNPKAVSAHLKSSWRKEIAHTHAIMSSYSNNDYTIMNAYSNSETPQKTPYIRLFITSPLRGLQTAIQQKCPQAAIVYPFWRLKKLELRLKHRIK